MNLTDLCIRRPVLATVMSLVIILLGLVTWSRLEVRQYPNVDEPRISIRTSYEGASPQIIEAQVTKILEDALSGIQGLSLMKSSSEAEESKINLTFTTDRKIDDAANDVRERISRVRAKLPSDVAESQIKKADADAFPFMTLAINSDRHSVKDISDYVRRFIENQVEVINGIASVDIWGGGEYEMHIYLDPLKMASFSVTAEDVAGALKRQNIEKPAGRIILKDREITVTTKASLITATDFSKLIIRDHDRYLVRLSDVGRVELDSIDTRSRVRFQDKPAIAMGIIKQSVANPLDIARDVKKLLPELQKAMPKGMVISIANDRTVFIDRSIDAVYRTLIEATILVILVILVFLRSMRAVLIPLVTIPVSLIGAFALMYFMGFTVNTLTLLALVLAIGLVVDDAIVMLENIYRHIEDGMAPMDAAFKGANEISFAVVAMTITLAAVYAPIALSQGQTGKIFTEFALTLAGSVLISGFVALTLSPMMCGRLLKSHQTAASGGKIGSKLHAFNLKGDAILNAIDHSYGAILRWALDRRLMVVVLGFVVAGLGYWTYRLLPQDFIPREDQGMLNIKLTPPFGANLEYTDKYMKIGENIFKQEIPELRKRLTQITIPGDSLVLGTLSPWEERTRRSSDMVRSLSDKLYEIPGVMAYAYEGGKALVSSASDENVEVVILSAKSHKELQEMSEDFIKVMRGIPGLQNIMSEVGNDEPELIVTVDRDKAAALGVEVASVAEMLDALISGRSPTKFKRENKLYNVRIELEEKFRKSPEDISGLFIRGTKNRTETMVPLSELVTISKQVTTTRISHFGGLRSVTFTAKLKEGYSLKDTLARIQEDGYQALPDGTKVDFDGESRRFLEEGSNIALIFGLAIAFIFLTLAAQYESYVDPIIILLSVPMSLAGGLFLLKLSGLSINLYSQIGFITLIGLISKHGILIVDFANKLKDDGLSKLDAVVEASQLRLRPILMTTFAMVLGAVPLALASGAGAESRQPIGVVIVGGMLLGTLFTLFVVPAVYTFLSRKTVVTD